MINIIGPARGCAGEWCSRSRRFPCPGRRSGTGDRSCGATSYAELDERVRRLLVRLRSEPDLEVRTVHLAALTRAERRMATLHRSVFPLGPATIEQAEDMGASARLLGAVTIASRGAMGERVTLPTWASAPWSSGATALRTLATTTDPARRARALEALAAALRPHLGSTATECLVELAAIEDLHAGPGGVRR